MVEFLAIEFVQPARRSRVRVLRLGVVLSSLFLGLELAKVVIQAIEALVPDPAVLLEPVGDVAKRRRVESGRTPLGIAAAADEAGAREHLEVPGHGWQAHRERAGQLADGGLAGGEAGEY